MKHKLMKGNNIELLKKLPENSIDSIVTDPPYGLSFMNKKWDYDVPSVDFWKEVYRVLKPGGHILSFGGTRTYHRMVVNIEDAGFEIRDQIQWLYGSGFPKSHNIGKAVDKLEGNEREVIGKLENYQDKRGLNGQTENVMENAKPRIDIDITKGTSEFEGWGTALKPANEPICLARKPLSEKSVAENVIKWKTGGINVDGCRISTTDTYNYKNGPQGNSFSVGKEPDGKRTEPVQMNSEGRFPANLILDEEAALMLDEQSGFSKTNCKKGVDINTEIKGGSAFPTSGYKKATIQSTINDSGGASRFFLNIKNNGGTEDFFIYKENNIIIWNIKSLDTQEYNAEDCIEASDVLKQARENICQNPELYGNNTTAKYLMSTISITKMKTHSIMTFTILNAYTKMNTGQFTLMINEKQSQLLTEENILNVQIVNNQNALVSFIKTNQEVLVPIVSYVLEENLVNGETIIENTIINTTENIETDRFFYIPKVSKKERNMGLDGFEDKEVIRQGLAGENNNPVHKNNHPTVKPVNLMNYLCRLITPPNGIILDPFMGSGSTGIAARLEGFKFIGMEMDQDYFKIAESRIENFDNYRKFIKK